MSLSQKRMLQQCLLLVVGLLALSTGNADSQTAQLYFENGNAAFRQGDFDAALGNYGNALAHGKDTPRVYYNMGLAHARLDQHYQARSSFMQSSQDEKLAALSFYQLGAIAHEEGDLDEAVDWLTRARDSASSDKLRRQSTRALEKLGVTQPRFESELAAGYGYDSNAFLSPDQPYTDFSGGTPTPVVPVPQSGPYVPIRVAGKYQGPISARTAFKTSYRFRGEYHTDPELQNADLYDHRVRIGGRHKIGRARSWNRSIGVDAYYRLHGETNFDRDDGLDRFDDGESIADRYDFRGIGGEADLRYRIGSTRLELEGGLEQRDYEDTPTASSYDMTNAWIGGDIKFDLSESSRLKLGYRYYVRDFDQRRSRDLTGDASLSNPTLEYRYNRLAAEFRHRFNQRFVAEVEYGYTIRTDQFVGYNDYRRHKIRLASSIDLTDRLQTRIMLAYRDQDYPNAFAFDEPGQPAKEYQDLEAGLVIDYRLTDKLALRAGVMQEIVESSDPRGEFERLRGALSLFWEYD